jgi:hypothetical protein
MADRSYKTHKTNNGERGAAVVEFAVVSVVLVLLVMWSHVFFDIIQIRMKLLEAARTAVFEFTAYELSDYNLGTSQGHQQKFKDALDKVKDEVNKIYGKDLDPAYKYKKRQVPLARLTLDQLKINEITVKEETEFNQSLWSLLNWFAGVPAFQSFNQRGYVRADTSADFTSAWAPTNFTFGSRIWVNPLRKRMNQTLYLLVDSWKLEDGCSVKADGTYQADGASTTCAAKTGESILQKEVGRVAFMGFEMPGGFDFGSLSSMLSDGINPLVTRGASVNFKGESTGGIPDPTQAGADGMSHLKVNTGETSFYTAPYCYTGMGGMCQGAYADAFRARGPYFMGCPKAQFDKKGECEYTKAGP